MKIIDAAAVLAVACPLAALPGTAAAGLYKCELDSGITYQQTPCPAGRELRDFDRNPATVSIVPFRIAPGSETRRDDSGPVPQASGHSTPDKARPARTDSAKAKSANAKPSRAADAGARAAERKFLIPGIYEGEVLARVGSPDARSGSRSKTMRWTYLPAPDDPSTVTTLTFHEGRLIEVERKVVRAP